MDLLPGKKHFGFDRRVRWKRCLFRVLAVLFGLLIVLLAVEIGLRMYGTIVAPEILDTPAFQGSPDVLVACYGDSYTYGIGASDKTAFSYPAQLERYLRKQNPDRTIQVLKRAVPGQSSSQMLAQLKNDLTTAARLPDLFVVVIGHNNPWHYRNATFLEKSDLPTFDRRKIVAQLERSRVGTLFVLLKRSLFGGPLSAPSETDDPDQTEARFLDRWLRADLGQIATLLRAVGKTAVFGQYHESLANPTIAAFGRENGLPVCPPPPAATYWRAMGYLSQDDWHPNERGYAAFAAHLAGCVQSFLAIIPARQPAPGS